MYYDGKGVTKDLIEAKNWFRKAAVQGDEEALDKLQELTRMGF
jgi:TPR repeat protein